MGIITNYALGNSRNEALKIASNVVEFRDLRKETQDTIIELLASRMSLDLPTPPIGKGIVFGANYEINNPGVVFYYDSSTFVANNTNRLLQYKYNPNDDVEITGFPTTTSMFALHHEIILGPIIPVPTTANNGQLLVSKVGGLNGEYQLKTIRNALLEATPNGIGGLIKLSELSDVTIINPVAGAVLTYNNVTNKWYAENDFNLSDKLVKLNNQGKIPSYLMPALLGDISVYEGELTNFDIITNVTIENGDILVDTISEKTYVANGIIGNDRTNARWTELLTAGNIISINNDTGPYVTLAFGELWDVSLSATSSSSKEFITGPIEITTPNYTGQGWIQNTLGLVDFNDVTFSSLVSNQFLSYNGSRWTNNYLNLKESLTDVVIDIPNLTTGQVLKYDGLKWINERLDLNNINGFSLSTLNNGEVIIYKDSMWTNIPFTVSNLNDVTISPSITNKNFLVYNMDISKWESRLIRLDKDLLDVVINTVTMGSNHVLVHNGNDWINRQLTLEDLANVELDTVTLATGHALVYQAGDGITAGKWKNISLTTDNSGLTAIATRIKDCRDVIIDSPVNNQMLRYLDGYWRNVSLSLFNSWDDCTISYPVQDKQVMIYRTNVWKNDFLGFNDLMNVSVSTTVDGQVLRYDSSGKWINEQLRMNHLIDVTTLDNQENQILKWRESDYKWVNSFITPNMFDTTGKLQNDVLICEPDLKFAFRQLRISDLKFDSINLINNASFVYKTSAVGGHWEIDTIATTLQGLSIVNPVENNHVIKYVGNQSDGTPLFSNRYLHLSELEDVNITANESKNRFLSFNNSLNKWSYSRNFYLSEENVFLGSNTGFNLLNLACKDDSSTSSDLNKKNIYIGNNCGPTLCFSSTSNANNIVIGHDTFRKPLINAENKFLSKNNVIIGNSIDIFTSSSTTSGIESNNVIIGNNSLKLVQNSKIQNSVIIGNDNLNKYETVGGSNPNCNILDSIIIGYDMSIPNNGDIEGELRIHNSNSNAPLIHGSFIEPHRWLNINGELIINNVSGSNIKPALTLGSNGITFHDDAGNEIDTVEINSGEVFDKKIRIKLNGVWYYMKLQQVG